MSRARDTRPDGLLGLRRRDESERTDLGSPLEMTGPMAEEAIASPLVEHPMPLRNAEDITSEDMIQSTLKALEEAAKKGVTFTPKLGASIADTSTVPVERRHALAYRSQGQHFPPAGHPTPVPEETMIVRRTPPNASPPEPARSPEPTERVAEDRDETSQCEQARGAPPLTAQTEPSLSDLLDSVDSDPMADPPLSRRDVPTRVPPLRRLRLLSHRNAIPLGIFAVIVAVGAISLFVMGRKPTERVAARRLGASPSTDSAVAPSEAAASAAARGSESEPSIASAPAAPLGVAVPTTSVSVSESVTSLAPIGPVAAPSAATTAGPGPSAVERPPVSKRAPKAAAPVLSSAPPLSKPPTENNTIMVKEL
jgi:hypothetical protein